jgi:hypothetical protein
MPELFKDFLTEVCFDFTRDKPTICFGQEVQITGMPGHEPIMYHVERSR